MKKYLWMTLVVVLLISIVGLAGCGKDESNAPGSNSQLAADIAGKVVELQQGDDGTSVKILVEEISGSNIQSQYDKAWVTITKDTKISTGDTNRKIEDIAVGQEVTVDFTGEVRESYPVQANAGHVVITKESN